MALPKRPGPQLEGRTCRTEKLAFIPSQFLAFCNRSLQLYSIIAYCLCRSTTPESLPVQALVPTIPGLYTWLYVIPIIKGHSFYYRNNNSYNNSKCPVPQHQLCVAGLLLLWLSVHKVGLLLAMILLYPPSSGAFTAYWCSHTGEVCSVQLWPKYF